MRCCVCDSAEAVPHLQAGGSSLVRCRDCGLVYAADFRTDRSIYSGDDYFTRRHDYSQRWDEFCAGFGGLLGKIRRYKQGGALLDVGAGMGALVASAARSGFDARGVEVSGWAASWARTERGLDVAAGTLEEAHLDAGSFDVVVINHVLEHVPDPNGLLREARRILAPGGLLVVGVPNIGSLMARLAGARWYSLQPDEHIWHFTPETLSRLLARAGFAVLSWEAAESHAVDGWGPIALVRRAINALADRIGRGEAMLFFSRKGDGSPG